MARLYDDDEELNRKADLIEQTPGVAGNGTARGLRAGVKPSATLAPINATLPPTRTEPSAPPAPAALGVRGEIETPLQIAQAPATPQPQPRPKTPEERLLEGGDNAVGGFSLFPKKPVTPPKSDKKSAFGGVRMASVAGGGAAIASSIGDAFTNAFDVLRGKRSLRSSTAAPGQPDSTQTDPSPPSLVDQIPTTTRSSLRTPAVQPITTRSDVREEEEVQSEQPISIPSFDNSDISVDAGGKSRSETAAGAGGYPAPARRSSSVGFRNIPILPGAFGSLASLGAAGAVSRLQRDQQRAETEQEKVGLSRDVAVANAARANAQLGLQVDQQREAQRVQRGKEMNALFEARATQLAGDPRPSEGFGGTLGIGKPAETEEGAKARAGRIKADMESDVAYTLTNNKLGDISTTRPETFQLLQNMAVIRQRVKEGRLAGDRSFKEFFGNNRFDSRDLLSYAPTKATPRLGGGWDIHLKNGNTVKLERAQGGEWKILGVNDPIDKDIADMIAPLIKQAENRR